MIARCLQGLIAGVLLILLLTDSQAQVASPVYCRDALRPVLMQTEPDLSALPEILALCEGQAAASDPDAVYHLAVLHLGLLDWQPDTAIPMIRMAAEQGIAEAQYWLGWQYEEGPLLEDDAEAALQWYIKAAEQEHRLAVNRLLDVYTHGGLGEVADEQKAAYYRIRLAKCMQKEAGMLGHVDTAE